MGDKYVLTMTRGGVCVGGWYVRRVWLIKDLLMLLPSAVLECSIVLHLLDWFVLYWFPSELSQVLLITHSNCFITSVQIDQLTVIRRRAVILFHYGVHVLGYDLQEWMNFIWGFLCA